MFNRRLPYALSRDLIVSFIFFLAPALLLASPGSAHAQDAAEGEGIVIVQFDDHASIVRPIDITEPISGIAALERSGLDIVVADSGFGPAVCSIEGIGCPAEDCFCDDQLFWAYSAWAGSAWQPAAVGAGASTVEPGAVEGWRWGPFESPQTPATASLAAQAALEWLADAYSQAEGPDKSMGGAVETMLLLGANGLAAEEWPASAGESIAAFVNANAAAFAAGGPAESGKLATAIAATRGCWPADAMRPAAYYDEAIGGYSTETGFHLWALLGTLALGEEAPDAAVQLVLERAQADGGWEWSEGWGTDTNTTALAVQALRAGGLPAETPEIQAAIDFFHSAQLADGGFAYDPAASEFGSDVNSTAYAIQGIIAAGQNPTGEAWRKEGLTPGGYLLAAQLEDGSFAWQPGTGVNPLSTQQAPVALLGQTFPIELRDGDARPCPVFVWPAWFEALIRTPLSGAEE